MQLPLLLPESDWTPPQLCDLPDFRHAKRICVDTETRDPGLLTLGPGTRRPDSYVVGYSVAIDGGPSFYVPLRHDMGGNLDNDQAWAYLRDMAADFRGDVVGANLQYDMDWLAQNGAVFRQAAFFRDVQIAEPLLDELQFSYSLNNIAKRHNLGQKDEALLDLAAEAFGFNPKSDMWRLHSRYVGPYATEDARLPLRILAKQERLIEAQGLQRVWDLESKVLPVLVKMRRRGVRVDTDRLARIEQWAETEEAAMLERVRCLTGVDIGVGNVWQPDAIAPALQALGVTLGLTSTGAWNIDKDVLARIDHAAARAVEKARKVNKLRTTFAKSVRDRLAPGDRIHCLFNQMKREKDDGSMGGAAYGRLSCEQPNLQQQPARDEFAKEWRSIYIPEDGQMWASCDYSSQEPRIMYHYAATKELPGAADIVARYQADPRTDSHRMMAQIIAGTDDITPEQRKYAKAIFLGRCYGMGDPKLCHQIGVATEFVVLRPENEYASEGLDRWDAAAWVPLDSDKGRAYQDAGHTVREIAGADGRRVIDTFEARLPFVPQLQKLCSSAAKARGYVFTLSGRRCRFPRGERGYDWTHKALNRLIQGSAGDQTKQALVDLDAAGYCLHLQVHDECCLSVDTKEDAVQAGTIMESGIKMLIPSVVDVEVGASWGGSM